jgi:hypothetical protein
MSTVPNGTARDYHISIPENWLLLPTPGDDIVAYLTEVVRGFDLPEEAAARLQFGLSNLTRLAHSKPAGARAYWALVRMPSSGRVDALVGLTMLVNDHGALERYRSAASAESRDGAVELVKRTVADREFPAGPAVVVHDFTLERAAGGVADPALERAFVTLFPAFSTKVFEFSLITQDLALFDDASEYLSEVVALVTTAPAGGLS